MVNNARTAVAARLPETEKISAIAGMSRKSLLCIMQNSNHSKKSQIGLAEYKHHSG